MGETGVSLRRMGVGSPGGSVAGIDRGGEGDEVGPWTGEVPVRDPSTMTNPRIEAGRRVFRTWIALGMAACCAMGQETERRGLREPQMGRGTGPWNRDVVVQRIRSGHRPVRLATFERAGVPTVARMADGRLVAAFQHFPEGDPKRFDRVAVAFSSDEGSTWTDPEPVVVEEFPEGMTRPFDPTLVPLPDGRIRMYFTSNRSRDFRRSPPAIHSAVSTQGVKFTYEPGVRFEAPGRIVIDCAVAVHRGVFHLVAPENGSVEEFTRGLHHGPLAGAGRGLHAVSRDGLNFDRVADLELPSRQDRWLGGMVSDGDRLLFFGTGPGPWPRVSAEGEAWSGSAEVVRYHGDDPGAVRLKDGAWLVVLTGPNRRRVEEPSPTPQGDELPY